MRDVPVRLYNVGGKPMTREWILENSRNSEKFINEYLDTLDNDNRMPLYFKKKLGLEDPTYVTLWSK